MGAEAIEAPTIRIRRRRTSAPLDRGVRAGGEFDWIVFTSANAVDAFMERLLAGPSDMRALGGAKLCGVGPATAEHLADTA